MKKFLRPAFFFLTVVLCWCLSCKRQRVLPDDDLSLMNWKEHPTVLVDSTVSLKIFEPKFNDIDLVCGTMPSEDDSTVVFFAEAAFTGALLENFSHSNIAGDHVASDQRYAGYACLVNSGAFVYAQGKWKFVGQPYSTQLDSAARHHGMGFSQILLVHHGEGVPISLKALKDHNRNIYRALCQHDGKLYVMESRKSISLLEFKAALLRLGVEEALYLDMGEGWNHSWYRDSTGVVHEIHPYAHPYCTNWIVFYQKPGR